MPHEHPSTCSHQCTHYICIQSSDVVGWRSVIDTSLKIPKILLYKFDLCIRNILS